VSTTFSEQRLLNAAVATGASPAFDLVRPHRTFTFEKNIAGVFTVLVVNYEGSMNGTTWYQIGTDNAITAAVSFAVDKPCRYVRANVTTFTGGTSVTVGVLACE
jgi:hypothetical protein